MKLLLAVAFVGFAAAAPLGESEYQSLWTQFKQDFTKSYALAEEHDARYLTFKTNVDFIMSHNERADEHGFTVGINQFADMTRQEFKKTMLTYQAERKQANPIKVFDTTNLADSVDGAYQIATGKLLSFSEQELVDCAGSYGNQGCNGGLMDDGFKYIEAKGDALESAYSYTGKTGTCNTAKQSAADGLKAGKVTSFNDVQSDSEPQMEAAVAKGPVSVAIEADQSGFQFYKSGVFSGTCGTKLDHGVLAVGYGTDGGKAYWKVKNSWGATWGSQGYIMLARNIASSKGQCGIAMQPSYPTMGSGPPPPPAPPTPPA